MYTQNYECEQQIVPEGRYCPPNISRKHQQGESHIVKQHQSGAKKDTSTALTASNQRPFQKLDITKDASCSSIWLKKGGKPGDSPSQKPDPSRKRGFANKTAQVDQFLITNKVYMSYADPKLTEEVLRAYFSSLGKVTQLYICNSFGEAQFVYGFVKFNSKKLAEQLVEKQMIMINGSPVRFRPVIERDPFKIAKILKNLKGKAHQKQKKQKNGKKSKLHQKHEQLDDSYNVRKNKNNGVKAADKHKFKNSLEALSPRSREKRFQAPTCDIRYELNLTAFTNKRLFGAISDSHANSENVVFNLNQHQVNQTGLQHPCNKSRDDRPENILPYTASF